MSLAKYKTSKQLRQMLARFVEIQVEKGYDISGVFAKPLNAFNYDYIQEVINNHDKEKNNF